MFAESATMPITAPSREITGAPNMPTATVESALIAAKEPPNASRDVFSVVGLVWQPAYPEIQ